MLSFFGVSLQSLVDSPLAQSNFAYLWHLVLSAWIFIVDATQSLMKNLPLKSLPTLNPNI